MKTPFKFRLCQGNEIILGRYKTAKGILTYLNKHPRFWLSCTVLEIEKNNWYNINEFIEKFTDPNSIKFIKSLSKK